MVNFLIRIEKRNMKTTNKLNILDSNKFIIGTIKYRMFQEQNKKIIAPTSEILNEKINKHKLIKNYQENELKKIDAENSYAISEYIKKTIIENENKIKILENMNKEIKDFNPTKHKHGFSAMIDDKYVYLTFFTSGITSPIGGGVLDNNIEINETLNPIIAVNIPQKMSIETFKNLFSFSNPQGILKDPKFGKNNDEDLAYFCFRAFVKSLKFSQNMYILKERSEKILEIERKNIFCIDNEGVIKLPIQYEIEEHLNDCIFVEELFNIVEIQKDNNEFKKLFLDNA
jgi:hypothetical protein